MISDLTLLALFLSNKGAWLEHHEFVKYSALTKEAQLILSDLEEFYVRGIGETPEQFATWFHQVQHPEFSEGKHHLYNVLFQRISEQPIESSAAFIASILSHFQMQDIKGKLQKQLESKETLQPEELEGLVLQLKQNLANEDKVEFDSNDIEDIMKDETRAEGIDWPLKCLNKSIGKLIKGDFGVVAAYVETGKTAFMTNLAQHTAKQITDGCVLYLNNESLNSRVQQRIWTGLLNMTYEEIVANVEGARQQYIELLHGDINRIKTINCTGWQPKQIRAAAKKYNPKLIIIDMLDKLEIPGKGEAADVIRLRKLYIAIRAIAKEFCPVIGTSQCDKSVTWMEHGEEQFQHYIGMHQLHGSKIDKQGEMEFMITIGKDPIFPSTRYIHVAKNKLPGDGNEAHRYIKSEVRFDAQLSKYTD